jgi:hypothetical protein
MIVTSLRHLEVQKCPGPGRPEIRVRQRFA